MISIIDYGAGNLKNVEMAFKCLGEKVTITNDKDLIKTSNAVVLPGVGSFKDAVIKLEHLKLIETILYVIENNIPFLGICLGLQLLFDYSEEGAQKVPGLGVFRGSIKHLPAINSLKIPHIGWNNVIKIKESSILKDIPNMAWFYFVHSYYLESEEPNIIVGKSEYGIVFDAVIESNNVYATQFHPEKSSSFGIQVIKNFIERIK